MVCLVSSISDCGEYVLAFQKWIIFEDLFKARTGAHELQDIGHPDSHSAKTRTTAALGEIKCNTVQVIGSHKSYPLNQFIAARADGELA